MSLFIYAPVIRPGTRELLDVLQAKRLVKHDGMRFLHKGVPIEFSPEDRIVCWGAHVPPIPGVPCLNTSYEYPNLTVINTNGTRKIMDKGYNAFVMRLVSDHEYQKAMRLAKPDNWWPAKGYKGTFVPITELDGYVTEYYAFTKLAKVIIFGGEIIDKGEITYSKEALNIMSVLGLDFATLYFGSHGTGGYLLKILTAPDLNDREVKLFAEKISSWAEKAVAK